MFEFGQQFIRGILWLMARDDAFAIGGLKWLEPGHFGDPHQRWIYETQVGSVAKGRPPDWLLIREQASKLSPEQAGAVLSEIDEVLKTPVGDPDGMREMLRDFAQRSLFANAYAASRDLYNAGKRDAAYDLMRDQMERLQGVRFEASDRQWLADEFDERQTARALALANQYDHVIPTGLPGLDAQLNGGIRKTHVHMIFAYAKRGKTSWLRHCGCVAMRLRRRVLHFNLEGTGQECADMYDAWFADEVAQNVRLGIFDPQKLAVIQAAYNQLRRLCVIRTANDWDTTVLDLEAEIRELRAGGWDPDLAIVDYLDILKPRVATGKPTEDQTNAAKDLKRFALRNNVGCWTGAQVQRPDAGADQKAHLIRANKLADAYAKIRQVDWGGSLNLTDEEKERGVGRLFPTEYRHGASGMVIPFRVDFGTSRFWHDPTLTISSQTKQVEIPSAAPVPKVEAGVQTRNWYDPGDDDE